MTFDLPGRFKDRYDAARKLLAKLTGLSDFRPAKLARPQGKTSGKLVIMAIPRGALELGYFLSRELKSPLDVALVKKVAALSAPELALGAVALDGEWVGSDEKNLEEQKNIQLVNLQQREKMFHARVPALALREKTILLVDDGIATGLTIRAAIEWLRHKKVKKIIVATPVASTQAAKKAPSPSATSALVPT